MILGRSWLSRKIFDSDFQFGGEQLDGNSGFYYNRARWMNSKVGRFISVDPFKGAIARPLSLNKYLYAEASPAWKADPAGLFGLSEALAAISLIGIQASLARPSMSSLRYTIYFRSFAPWESFGEGMGMGPFGGDNRSFSTSLTVTSRINTNITVDVRGNRVLNQRAWSDESTSGSSSGFGTPTLTVTRMGANGLKAKMEGSNPLVPFDAAADIDATMSISWKPQAAGNVCFDGNVVGDAFPNAEIFVKGSGRTTMLHTFQTAGERNKGPFDLLPGDNTRSMGAFSKCD